jgi:LemA protein
MTIFLTLVLVGMLFAIAAILIYGISIYNGLVTVKHNIDKSWSNIDVLLKQRHDELPKLVSTVEGYMKHERQVLENVTKARTAFMNANTVGEKAQADNMITGALKSLFAVSENYPQLRANENFMHLQGRISSLENEISDRREFYNDSVNTFNIRIEQIPDVFVARALNYQKREMFKVQEGDREDVKIRFAHA